MKNDNVTLSDFLALKNAVKEMETIKMGEAYIAAQKNNMYVKKDITEYFTDGTLYDRINARNGFEAYEGIFPGCYFDTGTKVTAPGSTETGTERILVCGLKMLNPYQFDNVDTPHIICTAATHFGNGVWNETNTTVGGFTDSYILKTILGEPVTSGSASGTISQQLYNIFGTHLKTVNCLLSTTMTASASNKMGASSGASTSWAWKKMQAVLFSEMEVYGGTVFSSSGFDTGEAKHQMPAFAYSEEDMMPYPIYYWLKDVANATSACFAHGNYGYAGITLASYRGFVRPRFVIS